MLCSVARCLSSSSRLGHTLSQYVVYHHRIVAGCRAALYIQTADIQAWLMFGLDMVVKGFFGGICTATIIAGKGLVLQLVIASVVFKVCPVDVNFLTRITGCSIRDVVIYVKVKVKIFTVFKSLFTFLAGVERAYVMLLGHMCYQHFFAFKQFVTRCTLMLSKIERFRHY